MEVRKYETITNYSVDVTDDITVSIRVVNNIRMYIERISIYMEVDELYFDYYAKVKYQRKIKDIYNLEKEIEEFVLDRLDKMKEKLDEVVEKYHPVMVIK